MRRVVLVVLGVLALAAVLAGCGPQATAPTAPPAASPDPAPSGGPSGGPSRGPSDPSSPPVEAFLRFATGEASGADVPWADEVALSLERTVVARLDPVTARTRTAWRGCVPRTATVEGRSCPVDVLRAVADRDRRTSPVVVENEPPDVVGCVRYEAPDARAGETVSWLRPATDGRDCFSDMAVAVTVSDAGEVVAVDLALSSP